MDSIAVRQSFFDFFKSKGHALINSSSLKPDAPNLLFTNAGMNQFVPYFLGERTPNKVRVVNTQKCIRAGGKHNDLEDVGFDTYHHTFFEMLGNWSLGDFFKKEAIAWAWELLAHVWNFPKDRIYVTVYRPNAGEPAEFDEESYDVWRKIFTDEGLSPDIHIKYGGKSENFWMMGDTGPCGPCSEIHIDLTPKGDTNGSLVNRGNPWCIEIWNLVFMQFNALSDGSFTQLSKLNVDTGMGFERVVGIISKTRNFTNFSELPSNYDSDLFLDIFHGIEKMCDYKYKGTIPFSRSTMSEQESIDFAFRVIADHIRALTFAISDGIFPSNDGRGYVLRRILRRAVTFCNNLDISVGSFAELSRIVGKKMGVFFKNLDMQAETVFKVILSEEMSFRKTLNRGMSLLKNIMSESKSKVISGSGAFLLYDTYGFPLDLTQLIAKESGYSVDVVAFDGAMSEQRERARAAQKKSKIAINEGNFKDKTKFIGYDLSNICNVGCEIVSVIPDGKFLVLDRTPFYAECGGQKCDNGTISVDGMVFSVKRVIKDQNDQILHEVDCDVDQSMVGSSAKASVDLPSRMAFSRNHTATHILHWALGKVLGSHVKQAGSSVGSKRLRFDFSHFGAVLPSQLFEIETLVQEKILECAKVKIYETEFDNKPDNCIANFDEKYGDIVRVVQIGDFSMELCGGCHVNNASEICLFKIMSESSSSAGVRRIEAITGKEACLLVKEDSKIVSFLAKTLSSKNDDVCGKVESLIKKNAEYERKIRSIRNLKIDAEVSNLLTRIQSFENGINEIRESLDGFSADELRAVATALSGKIDKYVIVLIGENYNESTVVAICSEFAVSYGHDAGRSVNEICVKYGGKGGGSKTFAMGSFN